MEEEKKEEQAVEEQKVEEKQEEKQEVKEEKEVKKEKKEVKLSAKLQGIVKEVEELSVMELADLVKALEEKFGVSAAPQAVFAPGGANGGDSGEAAGGDKKETVTISLQDAGQAKVQIIKDVKDILGLGLKEAKNLVDAAPKELKTNIAVAEAEEIKKKLEADGATVEIK